MGSWFRHHIYVYAFHTGHGVKTLSGVREAIQERYWVEVQEQIEILADVLDTAAQEIDRAQDASIEE